MSRQPEWKFIVNLGDADPINHGGAFVYEDKTGAYPPELELLQADDELDAEEWAVHRIVLEPCTYIDGVLSENPYHKDNPAWFADSLDGVARVNGMETAELIRLLCSDDATDRAFGYLALAHYHDIANFDAYPLKLQGRKELRQRYRRGELKR